MAATGRVRVSHDHAALMPIDFGAEGLLEDLHDPRERAERIALLQHLLHRGAPLEEFAGTERLKGIPQPVELWRLEVTPAA